MPTDKPRYTLILDEDLLYKLDIFWHENHLKNRNEAIVYILKQYFENRSSLRPDEVRLIDEYRKSENLAKAVVHGALQAGVRYANSFYSHRAPATTPLDESTPEPSAHINADSITYRDGKDVITEKFPASPDDITGNGNTG